MSVLTLSFVILCCGLPSGIPSAPADASSAQKNPGATAPDAKARALAQAELDRLRDRAGQLAADGKLPEAIAAGEKAIGLTRVLDGPNADGVANWQAWLAPLYEKQLNWSAARKSCEEALVIR